MASNKFIKTITIDFTEKSKVEVIEKQKGGFSGWVNKELKKYKMKGE